MYPGQIWLRRLGRASPHARRRFDADERETRAYLADADGKDEFEGINVVIAWFLVTGLAVMFALALFQRLSG
jgi:hypothetical protein